MRKTGFWTSVVEQQTALSGLDTTVRLESH